MQINLKNANSWQRKIPYNAILCLKDAKIYNNNNKLSIICMYQQYKTHKEMMSTKLRALIISDMIRDKDLFNMECILSIN